MSSIWVVLAYSGAMALALVLLYFFEPTHWLWHVMSLVVALCIGLAPIPSQLNTPEGTLLIGSLFMFCFFWGIGAPVFRKYHYHGGHHAHHA